MEQTLEQLDGIVAGIFEILASLYMLITEVLYAFMVVIMVLIIYIILRAMVRSFNFHTQQRRGRRK